MPKLPCAAYKTKKNTNLAKSFFRPKIRKRECPTALKMKKFFLEKLMGTLQDSILKPCHHCGAATFFVLIPP